MGSPWFAAFSRSVWLRQHGSSGAAVSLRNTQGRKSTKVARLCWKKEKSTTLVLPPAAILIGRRSVPSHLGQLCFETWYHSGFEKAALQCHDLLAKASFREVSASVGTFYFFCKAMESTFVPRASDAFQRSCLGRSSALEPKEHFEVHSFASKKICPSKVSWEQSNHAC